MAEIQDMDEEAGEIEVVEQQDTTKEQAAAVEQKVEDVIPDEFKGMSVAELARIAQHARKEMGRQGNELGEIRKLADELIKSQLKKQPEPEPVKEVDFFENPQEAIRRQIETNPEVMAAKQYAVLARQAQAKAEFERKHPDSGQILQEQQFGEWISKSKVRTELFQKANAFDLDAADELFSTYKELKQVKTEKQKVEVPDEEKASRTKTLQSVAVETGGSGESSKKVYRRTDLIRLKMRDPSKFDSMQSEIDAAYREGRVR
jgi:hypothetical protein